jgi:hypothetical protein
MAYGDIEPTFIRHNQGKSWRAIDFVDDCWMMMLGFPVDYMTEKHIHNAINDFGRLILWEESQQFPGRVLARARVTNVHEVPQLPNKP